METKLDVQQMLSARNLVASVRSGTEVRLFTDIEFKCYSQFGDDGIIQYLIHRLGIEEREFVEFGVEDYRESNTRFLLRNDNWRGMVIDGSQANVERIRNDPIYWQHDLTAISAFIDRDNIDGLISGAGFAGTIGILSVDIDGNDYWVWERIECISPKIVICEYNSVFGPDRSISIPYAPSFVRSTAHFSYLYYGASLSALTFLARRKGYSLVGSNSAGNNAYFLRDDQLGLVSAKLPRECYVASKFRESRDADGRFNYLAGQARLQSLAGLPVVNVETGALESL